MNVNSVSGFFVIPSDTGHALLTKTRTPAKITNIPVIGIFASDAQVSERKRKRLEKESREKLERF